jgi:hypothetical protein
MLTRLYRFDFRQSNLGRLSAHTSSAALRRDEEAS